MDDSYDNDDEDNDADHDECRTSRNDTSSNNNNTGGTDDHVILAKHHGSTSICSLDDKGNYNRTARFRVSKWQYDDVDNDNQR
mmetsp:Transcript_28516/g.62008  ORF Transcript_28516/g.62008 Transcript_28516/m.62008 type:complete len:83 (+) Transcript_28516:559-807(+)